MNQAISRHYIEVQRIKRLRTSEFAAGKYPGQPPCVTVTNEETGETVTQPLFVWASSRRHLGRCTTEAKAAQGKGVCCIPFDLYCNREVEWSHGIASESEIQEFAEFSRVQRIAYQQADLKSASKFEVSLPGAPK